MSPKVAIILVNYNGYEDTVECVNSLLNISYQNITIYIVDNGSNESGSIKADSFLRKKTRIIQSMENVGFSGGNNLAIREILKVEFDYILFLNNDTIVEPNFLTELINGAENDNDVGILGGKIYFYHDRTRVWAAGGEYNRKTGLTIQYGGADREEINREKYVTFTTGCLMLIPCDVIRKVGLLDESFFLYSEDSDYCQRVIDAGYRIKYIPSAKIYHKVSSAIGDSSYLQQRYMMRNDLYMIKKYSKNRYKAYICVFYKTLKDLIKRRKNIFPLVQGISDYVHGRKGKI